MARQWRKHKLIYNQRKLTKTLKRCAEKNIVLNEDKQQTGLTEITFHGHRITKDGVKADEAKVEATATCQRLPM